MIAKSSHRECSEPLSQSYFIASLPFDDHKQRVGTDPPIIGCLHIRLTFVTAKISDVFVPLLWARLFWREMLYQVSTGNYSNVANVKTHGRKRKMFRYHVSSLLYVSFTPTSENIFTVLF